MVVACNCTNHVVNSFLTGLAQGFLLIWRLLANLVCANYHVHLPFGASDAYTLGFIVGVAVFMLLVSWLLSLLLPTPSRGWRGIILFVLFVLIIWAMTR